MLRRCVSCRVDPHHSARLGRAPNQFERAWTFLDSVVPLSAFEKLVESHMLSAEEEAALLASLRFKEDELWLKAMYRGRLHKYDVSVVEPLSLAAEDDSMDHNSGAHAAEAAETRVRALDRARAIFANRLPAFCYPSVHLA